MDKNILACLEIADHELRLVVGQFFNSRLNILKVERISHEAILNQSITHETKIIELIQKMLENTSQNLGVKIEKVIALIPDLEVKHVNHQLRLTINGNISEEDIHQAYRSLQDNAVPDHKVLINTVVNRYFVNGIFTRKIPLNEKAANMTVDGDLYFADAKNVFAYIGAIEKAKLEVMDVVLSGLAFGKEASLYERSINTPIIAFNAGDYTSTLSLFYKGRLVESTHVPKGIYTFIERLYKELKIPADLSRKLLFDNFSLASKPLSDKPAFVWSTKSKTHSVSQEEIVSLLYEDMNTYLAEIIETISPIFEIGAPDLVLTGEIALLEGIDEYIEKHFDLKTQLYIPQTYGVRDATLATIIGAFYFYKDQSRYRLKDEASVDMKGYRDLVLNIPKSEDESITKKIKHIFFE